MFLKRSWILVFLILPLTTLPPTKAKADDQGRAAFKAAVASCRDKLSLPAHTAGGPKLTADQRSELHACLAEAGVSWPRRHPASSPDFRVRLAACFQQDGVAAPTPGTKPTDEQKAEFKKCRAEIKAAN